MTINEFEAFLAEHEEQAKKYEELKAAIAVENEVEMFEALSKAAAEIGCEISPAEFAVEVIANGALDDEELEKVGGGRDWCWADYNCYTVLKHPKAQNKDAACLADYKCVKAYHGTKVETAVEGAKEAVQFIKDNKKELGEAAEIAWDNVWDMIKNGK